MKLIAAYHKGQEIAMISHLDIQRTLQRAFRRAGLPLLYSGGFNPHPQFSFATAAATGMSSDGEWFEVQLYEDVSPEEFLRRANDALPNGMSVSDAFIAPENFGSLGCTVRVTAGRAIGGGDSSTTASSKLCTPKLLTAEPKKTGDCLPLK